MLVVLYILIGVCCLTAGRKYFANASKIMKSRKVTGRLVDYNEVRQGKRVMYSPVYEYEDGGEVKQYASSQVFLFQERFGTEKILFISENGEVSDYIGDEIL